MSQKNSLQSQKEQLLANKAKLETIKSQQPDKWTNQMQVKLDEIIGEIADIDESTNAENPTEGAETSGYKPEEGTENLFHVEVVRGHRYNPHTGKEESRPYVQLFTKSEFEVFEKHAKNLGYEIIKILYKPETKKVINTK